MYKIKCIFIQLYYSTLSGKSFAIISASILEIPDLHIVINISLQNLSLTKRKSQVNMSHIDEYLENNRTPARRANISSAWNCYHSANQSARVYRWVVLQLVTD